MEPVNGIPCMYPWGGTTLVFEGEPDSGTDKLRARTLCQLHFDKISQPQPESDATDPNP